MSTKLNRLACESGAARAEQQSSSFDSNELQGTLPSVSTPTQGRKTPWASVVRRGLSALLVVTALAGCSSLPTSAKFATAADAGTTAVGVMSGLASEANPIIASPAVMVAMVAARFGLVEYAERLPEPQRTAALAGMNSMWWGVAASNLAIIAAGSNPIGLLVGAATAAWMWNDTEDQRLFASICVSERVLNPGLKCSFNNIDVAIQTPPVIETASTQIASAQ